MHHESDRPEQEFHSRRASEDGSPDCLENAGDQNDNGPARLNIAVLSGDAKQPKTLLQKGFDVDKCGRAEQEFHNLQAPDNLFPDDFEEADYHDEQGRIPLHIAVQSEDANLVKALLQKGCDVNERDNDGRTALHYARGADVLRVLLECVDIDINVTDDEGRTALHYAAMEGERVPLRLLLENGIDPNVCDKYGKTPYDYSEGQMEVIMFARIMFLLSYQLP
jgi:ankyrin repeat protein